MDVQKEDGCLGCESFQGNKEKNFRGQGHFEGRGMGQSKEKNKAAGRKAKKLCQAESQTKPGLQLRSRYTLRHPQEGRKKE